MKKIGDITNTADKNGEFTNGNVAAGTPPTTLEAPWFNSVQREILNVLLKANIAQSPEQEDQLAKAIQALAGTAVSGKIKQTPGTSTTDIMSQKAVTDELSKKQNSGDFATNAALKDGLDKKFDKTGGDITGAVTVKASGLTIAGANDYSGVNLKRPSSGYVRIEANPVNAAYALNIVNRGADGGNISTISIPNKTGALMQVGDFGVGDPTLLDADSNLSIATRAGQFKQIYSGLATIEKEYPASGRAGTLINYPTADGNTLQEYRAFNASHLIYYRAVKTNGTQKGVSWIYQLNSGNTTTDRNGCLKASGSAELSDYPPGAPIPWPQATAPAGFLVCNGQSFNKTTYPLLTKAYPSGVLPDLRGEFIRGLDAGRNIDENRDVLSAQQHQYEKHNHDRNIDSAVEHVNLGKSGGIAGAYTNGGASYIRTYDKTGNAGGNETRPRNIAFLYIVRAA